MRSNRYLPATESRILPTNDTSLIIPISKLNNSRSNLPLTIQPITNISRLNNITSSQPNNRTTVRPNNSTITRANNPTIIRPNNRGVVQPKLPIFASITPSITSQATRQTAQSILPITSQATRQTAQPILPITSQVTRRETVELNLPLSQENILGSELTGNTRRSSRISALNSLRSQQPQIALSGSVRQNITFNPVKNINVENGLTDTLRSQLKNQNSNIKETALKTLETRIVTMQGKCAQDIISNLRVRTFQLDAKLMDEYLNSDGRYDYKYQGGVGCLVDALISEKDDRTDSRLRRWITDINKIGKKTHEGDVFQINNADVTLYAIKVAADADDDTMPHEALIGMGALNNLRDKIPTFMYIYGTFMCDPPILDDNNEVLTWCPSKTNPITYLVLENIEGASSLKALMWDITENEYLEIYLQILNAINVASKAFDYTHYDLHSENVLIQTLSYYVLIPLYNNNGTFSYIRTKRLVRIIDYGFSHIKLQGQHFGVYGYEDLGIDPESSFPMYDAYKLLLNSYAYNINNEGLKRSIGTLTDVANGIYSFFNEGKTIETRLIEQKTARRDYLQPSPIHKNLRLSDLIWFIVSKYKPKFIVKVPQPNDVLTVCHDKCVNWDGFIKHIFDRSRLPLTLQDYCLASEAINKLASDSNRNEIGTWLSKTRIDNLYNKERGDINTDIFTIFTDLNQINLEVDINTSKVNETSALYNRYKRNLRKLLEIKSKLTSIDIWINTVYCAYRYENRELDINRSISTIVIEFDRIQNQYQRIIDVIRQNKSQISFDNDEMLIIDILFR